MDARIAGVLVVVALAASCTSALGDARESEIATILARADEATIRARPGLSVGKYAVMAAGAYEYYRGTLPVFREDWRAAFLAPSRFALDFPLVVSVGDAHPENFGTMRASDGTVALEPNDFDAADEAPYLWDVRRLACGMALAAHLANADDAAANAKSAAAARAVARAVAEGYRDAIRARATGAPPSRVTDGGGNALLVDLFRRSHRDLDARAELASLTVLSGGVRRLRRGVLDPTSPANVFLDVPDTVRSALPAALERYRRELVAPPPPEYFQLLDVARELGSGVASWAKVRAILLVRGPTDDPSDDVTLELKELVDSENAGMIPPGVTYDDVATRVRETSRAAWARPDADALWGTTEILGMVAQIKTEADGYKTVRVAKMTGAFGTPEVLADLARRLGALVARVHAAKVAGREDAALAIADRIGADLEGFADEQADVAASYAAQALTDFQRFQHALRSLGPLLGMPTDSADAPSTDAAAIFAAPVSQ